MRSKRVLARVRKNERVSNISSSSWLGAELIRVQMLGATNLLAQMASSIGGQWELWG